MKKETISNKVLKKIQSEKIKPKPRWEFLLKNYVFWGAFALSIFIGGLASSIAIFKITTTDWDVARKLGHHPISFGFQTMPYFWLIILAIFIFVAYYNFKHTKEGFKFRLPLTITASILASIILGFALFGAGIAKRMDEQALKHIPMYQSMEFKPKMEMWSQIDKGLLAGEITAITNDYIEIESLDGTTWKIKTEKISEEILENLEERMPIRIIGQTSDEEEGVFNAEDIRPWKGNFLPPRRINQLPMKEMKMQLRNN